MPQLPEPSIEQVTPMHHALEQTLQERAVPKQTCDIETGFRLFYETLHRRPLGLIDIRSKRLGHNEDFSADNYRLHLCRHCHSGQTLVLG